jgi:UDP:flavonoid glycosyltransferase YjiC (YdhE family)
MAEQSGQVRPRRIMLAAFGDAGHAFPAIALGRALVRRGHEVCLETWRKWEEDVEREGMRFSAAPEYDVFPTRDGEFRPYARAMQAARDTLPTVREFDPDVVVVDIVTVAGALAAEMDGRPWATLVPHVLPTPSPGFPPYSIGARLPRTAVGRAAWRAFDPLVRVGMHEGRDDLNRTRAELGLPPLDYVHNGLSRRLAVVATFPQLEYPRPPESWVEVTGPLLWERPFGEVELPPGEEPLVLVAPSTAQDPEQRMLLAALEGLADLPVRVLATTNRRDLPGSVRVPANARLVDWLSYSRTMPLCAAVVCHGGHGTTVRALASGAPVVACPAVGDMAENASRVAWAGAGVSLPRRLVSVRGIRLAVERVLGELAYAERARELGEWAAEHDGGEAAARAVEAFAEREARA